MNNELYLFYASIDWIKMALVDDFKEFLLYVNNKYPLIIYIDIKDLLRMSKRRWMAFQLCSDLWKRPTMEMKTETMEDLK